VLVEEKINKCCIDIVKGTNNLRQKKLWKKTHIVKQRECKFCLMKISSWVRIYLEM